MAHFAELDANNIVQRVIVISNADIIDGDGVEQETLGIQVCHNIYGADTTWVQTSYNNNFRKRYAGVGDKFVADADLFYNPVAPYPSWSLDENYDWQPPTPMPDDGNLYIWDEDSLTWVEIPTEEPEP
jgi:hypothetical protein